MSETIKFEDRASFRQWLTEHCLSSCGIWILFEKNGGKSALKASEALEEALCFGWIDGQMQSLDDKTYKKYFCMRRTSSKWSAKNKTLAEALEARGLMTEFGRAKI